jgi:hypothetical protein
MMPMIPTAEEEKRPELLLRFPPFQINDQADNLESKEKKSSVHQEEEAHRSSESLCLLYLSLSSSVA